MKSEGVNYNPIARKHYTCAVCGKGYPWSDGHRYIERTVGNGYAGYEVGFVTCSDACRSKQRQVFIDWLGSYEGWTKESAAENFDKYIKPNNTKADQ